MVDDFVPYSDIVDVSVLLLDRVDVSDLYSYMTVDFVICSKQLDVFLLCSVMVHDSDLHQRFCSQCKYS